MKNWVISVEVNFKEQNYWVLFKSEWVGITVIMVRFIVTFLESFSVLLVKIKDYYYQMIK